MSFRRTLFVLLLSATASFAQAQVRIGYTNIEIILSYMPETASLESELGIFQKKKAEELKTSEDYANVKLEEYQQLKSANRLSPEEDKRRQTELLQLDAELQKKAQQAEFDLLTKREELLAPIMDKLQSAINTVAKEKGYTYILNQTTSAGVSTILFGPEDDDITKEVMTRLGIDVTEK